MTSQIIIGADSSEFSIVSGEGSFSLAPSQTWQVKIRFIPTSQGTKTVTYRIESNDPDENPKDIPLSGGKVPDIAVNPPSWDYGDVAVGITSDKVFTVSNTGNRMLNVMN